MTARTCGAVLSPTLARSRIIRPSSLTARSALTSYSYNDSLSYHGTPSEYGSHTNSGTLHGSGSLARPGTLAGLGSLLNLVTITKIGSFASPGTLRGIDSHTLTAVLPSGAARSSGMLLSVPSARSLRRLSFVFRLAPRSWFPLTSRLAHSVGCPPACRLAHQPRYSSPGWLTPWERRPCPVRFDQRRWHTHSVRLALIPRYYPIKWLAHFVQCFL